MKRLAEYNREELIELSNEEYEKLVNLECAFEGAPLLPADPGPEPVAPELTPDITTFAIDSLSFRFVNKDDADKIHALLIEMPLCKVSGYGDEAHIAPFTRQDYHYPKAVESAKEISKALYDSKKDLIREHSILLVDWKELHNNYRKCIDKRKEIIARVRDAIGEAKLSMKKEQDLRNAFAQYLGLAEGDHRIAAKFFLNAFPKAADEFHDLMKELSPELLMELTLREAADVKAHTA